MSHYRDLNDEFVGGEGIILIIILFSLFALGSLIVSVPIISFTVILSFFALYILFSITWKVNAKVMHVSNDGFFVKPTYGRVVLTKAFLYESTDRFVVPSLECWSYMDKLKVRRYPIDADIINDYEQKDWKGHFVKTKVSLWNIVSGTASYLIV
jgi:hypothetical protein